MTDSLAVTADGQPNFLATIFSMAANILPKRSSFVYQRADENQEEITFLPPCVNAANSNADRRITITNCPPVNAHELNYCAIERILNHIKDSYILGQYDDSELEEYCNNRKVDIKEQDFCFCLTYIFNHDDNNTLSVDFYVSHTDDAPAWGQHVKAKTNKRSKTTKFVSATPMSQKEVNLFADAFVRQCVRALRSYTTLVYNYASDNNMPPDYYGTDFPK